MPNLKTRRERRATAAKGTLTKAVRHKKIFNIINAGDAQTNYSVGAPVVCARFAEVGTKNPRRLRVHFRGQNEFVIGARSLNKPAVWRRVQCDVGQLFLNPAKKKNKCFKKKYWEQNHSGHPLEKINCATGYLSYHFNFCYLLFVYRECIKLPPICLSCV